MTFSKVRLSALTVFVAAVFASACGSTPASPTGGVPSGTLDLTGAWTGTLATNGSNDTPNLITWSATQSGGNSTGVSVITVDTGGTTTAKVSGTLAGVGSGTGVAWTLTMPAGSLTALGSATCSISGTGTSSAGTTSALTAQINLTFTQACVGTVTDPGHTTEVDTLILRK